MKVWNIQENKVRNKDLQSWASTAKAASASSYCSNRVQEAGGVLGKFHTLWLWPSDMDSDFWEAVKLLNFEKNLVFHTFWYLEIPGKKLLTKGFHCLINKHTCTIKFGMGCLCKLSWYVYGFPLNLDLKGQTPDFIVLCIQYVFRQISAIYSNLEELTFICFQPWLLWTIVTY